MHETATARLPASKLNVWEALHDGCSVQSADRALFILAYHTCTATTLCRAPALGPHTYELLNLALQAASSRLPGRGNAALHPCQSCQAAV